MTVSREQDGSCNVRAVDIIGRNMRHRITFPQGSRIWNVFRQEVADRLAEVLDDLPADTHVFSRPDLVIELPGLTLARMRALINVAANGVTQIILRFRYFIGALQSVFRDDSHFTTPTLDHRERIAVETLADIATPIFGMALSGRLDRNDAAGYERVARKLDELSKHASEVNFYLSLLTRYVTDCSQKNLDERSRTSHPLARIA